MAELQRQLPPQRHVAQEVTHDCAWRGETPASSTFFVRLEFAGLVGVAVFGVDFCRPR
jgi:hypothetical protein